MARKGIPNEVKKQVEDIVARFHTSEIRNPRCRYVPRYREKLLYLDSEELWTPTSHLPFGIYG